MGSEALQILDPSVINQSAHEALSLSPDAGFSPHAIEAVRSATLALLDAVCAGEKYFNDLPPEQQAKIVQSFFDSLALHLMDQKITEGSTAPTETTQPEPSTASQISSPLEETPSSTDNLKKEPAAAPTPDDTQESVADPAQTKATKKHRARQPMTVEALESLLARAKAHKNPERGNGKKPPKGYWPIATPSSIATLEAKLAAAKAARSQGQPATLDTGVVFSSETNAESRFNNTGEGEVQPPEITAEVPQETAEMKDEQTEEPPLEESGVGSEVDLEKIPNRLTEIGVKTPTTSNWRPEVTWSSKNIQVPPLDRTSPVVIVDLHKAVTGTLQKVPFPCAKGEYRITVTIPFRMMEKALPFLYELGLGPNELDIFSKRGLRSISQALVDGSKKQIDPRLLRHMMIKILELTGQEVTAEQLAKTSPTELLAKLKKRAEEISSKY